MILPLLPTANATHPAINAVPPSGVTGPSALNLSGAKTSKYIEPLNIVMPAVRNDLAQMFCRPGKATSAVRRTAEWMS